MDDNHLLASPEKDKTVGERKCHLNLLKDAKRKLSFVNKRIGDFHHQRKFIYKNSVKAKKVIHNQVNQIVKCLRVRERSLCSDVDDAYMSQDVYISEELTRLQSVYSSCQAFVNNLENFKEKSDILKTVYAILSEVNFCEKPDAKVLEFISDFETMKKKANNYGYLEGEFVKKDDFVLIVEEKKHNDLSNINYKQAYDKAEILDASCLPSGNGAVESMRKYTSYNAPDCGDFQIIDLMDNMHCHDTDDDFLMAEDMNVNNTLQASKECSGSSSKILSKFITNSHNTSENSNEVHENSKGFDPEEEWKQISELNKKIASFHEMTTKLSEDSHHKKTVDCSISATKLHHKNCEEERLFIKEVDDWLNRLKPKVTVVREKTIEKFSADSNYASPAELIKKSFKPYFANDNIQNWLSSQ